MIDRYDFSYAMENTRVVVAPESLIETFGTTSFRFLLVSELMDEVNAVRVRGGTIDAERPRIMSPHSFQKLVLDGFSEGSRNFADWLESQAANIKILRYGFNFRKKDLREEIVHDSLEVVLGRLREEIGATKENVGKDALIAGVEEAWEVCLLKFTMEMIQRSASGNIGEWKQRGYI